MSIEVGTKIGRYEIQSLLGVGGMGEVYRAIDTELRRPVAIKLLPAEFALHANRMKRFIQEARAASALNHPNIITVYEIGRVGPDETSAPFFATELIEGVTLRDYMSRTKLKLAEILDISSQIASALVAAHQAGIVHRDIKPENIMIRHDGYVKVLDFGLAKPTERAANSVDSEADTRALAHTDPGTVMGTVSYMSPEQAKGSNVDGRTDIWSLGVVLYELIAGRTPFAGPTPSHVIVALLENDPAPLSALVEDVPEALELIVDEALRKDRDERTQTAKQLLGSLRRLKQRLDAGTELERLTSASLSGEHSGLRFTNYRSQSTGERAQRTTVRSGQVNAQTASSAEYVVTQIKQHKTAMLLVGIAAVLAVVVASFGVYRLVNKHKVNVPLAAMKITRLTNNGVSSGAVISPDGKYVAHVFTAGDQHSLRLRQTATSQSRDIVPLTNEYLLGVTFSPDGNFLYYVKGGRGQSVRTLYQVSVLGGDPRQLIYDIDSAVTFSPDGKKIAFIRGYLRELRKALFIANLDGSGEEEMTQRRAPEFSFMESPAWSPDGKTVAFIVGGNDAEGYFVNIDEINVADKTERKITADRWRDITSIAWLNESSVLAVARDRAAVAGSPDQIWQVSRVAGKAQRITNDLNYYIDVSVAADSHTLTATVKSDTSTIWITGADNLGGLRQATTSSLSGLDGLAWTPDGRIVYTTLERDNRDIWIMNADGSSAKQLTFENSGDLYPSVSPDGRYITFVSNRGVGWGIWKMNSDGSNQVELVANTEEGLGYPEFTADSQSVIYSGKSKGKQVLFKVSIDGGQPVQLTEKAIFNQAVSPDRRSVVYYFRPPELDSKQTMEIIALDGSVVPRILNPLGDGSRVQWSPDSKSLDYIETRSGVSNLWRRPVDGNGDARKLSDWRQDLVFRFAWSFDGKQLACARGVHASDVVLIENLDISD